MWETIFERMVSRLVRTGKLRVTYPDGRSASYGPGGALTASVTIRDTATLRGLCLRPDLTLGEAYMDGRLTVGAEDLDSLIALIMRNRYYLSVPIWVKWAERARFRLGDWLTRNTPLRAKANVAHHYDLSNDLYRLFLDEDMQYSCAYFAHPEMSLEQAQEAKKAHIAAKLQLRPGMRVLDIGCGWGGLAITLARDHGAHVLGVTLSENQLALARDRVAAAGLEDRIDLRLLDYRLLQERFDRIVSVGMLEHVGTPHYREYFARVEDLLAGDGVALIHTIGLTAPPKAQSEWLVKYIFPGGYVPSLSELAKPIEDSGLYPTDLEVLRLHYAMTLRHWKARFDAAEGILRQMYDDRFIRMFRYYFTICYLAFEEQHQAVFQFQLAKSPGAVPITRDYLYSDAATEHRTRAAE